MLEGRRLRSSTPTQDVSLQTTFLGGAFGRRIDGDFVVQAAQISKAVKRLVKLVWSREDDGLRVGYRRALGVPLAERLRQ